MSKICGACNNGKVKSQVLKTTSETCSYCGGKGSRLGQRCSDCLGTGSILTHTIEYVDIDCVICSGTGRMPD